MNTKKIISICICCSLVLPLSVFAQEVVSSEPSPSSEPAPAPQSSETQVPSTEQVVVTQPIDEEVVQTTVNPTQESVTPQDSDNSQSSIDTNGVENTFDPHNTNVQSDDSSTTTSIIINIEDNLINTGTSTSSTTDITTPTNTSTNTDNIVTPVQVIVEDTVPNIVTIEEVMIPTPTINSVAELKEAPADMYTVAGSEPETTFKFNIDHKTIPTKEDTAWSKTLSEKNIKSVDYITEAPKVIVDNVEGVLDVSGSCSDKYYVVLLYSKKEDYDTNASSYVFNKAFDCVNGKYNYSIKDLPKNLESGTYYLLVGGQGDTGSWYPITALLPINIVNQ